MREEVELEASELMKIALLYIAIWAICQILDITRKRVDERLV